MEIIYPSKSNFHQGMILFNITFIYLEKKMRIKNAVELNKLQRYTKLNVYWNWNNENTNISTFEQNKKFCTRCSILQWVDWALSISQVCMYQIYDLKLHKLLPATLRFTLLISLSSFEGSMVLVNWLKK